MNKPITILTLTTLAISVFAGSAFAEEGGFCHSTAKGAGFKVCQNV